MGLIAVDFDNTICDTGGAKIGVFPPPLAGAREALNVLREAGHKIMIFSCNSPVWIERWMNEFDIRYDYMWKSGDGAKPMYDLLIDDRALRFVDWTRALNEAQTILGPVARP